MKYLAVFSVLVLIAAVICGFIPTPSDAEIYDDVMRIHVIANSDEPLDQGAKLIVRNAVLSFVEDMVGSAGSAAEAASLIGKRTDDILEIVKDALLCAGESPSCSVALSYEYYPTREYDGVSLPAGRYRSLRVVIGDGEGQNFWCVLFPTVCTSGAKAKNVLKQTGFSPDQINILTEDEKPVYKIKFKFLEFFSEMSS